MATPASIFDRFRGDHRTLLARLDEIEGATNVPDTTGAYPPPPPAGTLGPLVALLERQFAVNMQAEDDVVFPAVTAAVPEAAANVEVLRVEHAELRQMLAELKRTLDSPHDSGLGARLAVQVRDLVDLLRIHIRKEESVVYRVSELTLPARDRDALVERLARSLADESAAGHAAGGAR